jgi:hypothetical protein
VEYKRDKARHLTCTVNQDYGPVSGTIIYELLLLTHSLWTTFSGYLSLHQWKDDESNGAGVNLKVARPVPISFKEVGHDEAGLVNDTLILYFSFWSSKSRTSAHYIDRLCC